jgi:hypothetical protein
VLCCIHARASAAVTGTCCGAVCMRKHAACHCMAVGAVSELRVYCRGQVVHVLVAQLVTSRLHLFTSRLAS